MHELGLHCVPDPYPAGIDDLDVRVHEPRDRGEFLPVVDELAELLELGTRAAVAAGHFIPGRP